jgi:hypothetical protein
MFKDEHNGELEQVVEAGCGMCGGRPDVVAFAGLQQRQHHQHRACTNLRLPAAIPFDAEPAEANALDAVLLDGDAEPKRRTVVILIGSH